MVIKELDKSDLMEALDLIWNVFEEFQGCDYSKEGINNFKSFIEYNSMLEEVENKEMFFLGAYTQDKKLVGVISMRDCNHISLLFVDKKFHKKGIGRKLFFEIINYLNDKNEIKRMTVNSSPFAVEFYHRLGFVDLGDEIEMDGIRYTPMKYEL